MKHAGLIKKALVVLAVAVGAVIPLSAPASASLFDGAKGQACVAVEADNGSGQCDQAALDKGQTALSDTLTNLLNLLSMVVGILSIIMIIISGIRFVTSNGDSNQITSARNTFIYSLVGLIIVAFAQVIVKLVLTRIS